MEYDRLNEKQEELQEILSLALRRERLSQAGRLCEGDPGARSLPVLGGMLLHVVHKYTSRLHCEAAPHKVAKGSRDFGRACQAAAALLRLL